jgi:hypothetical protein
MTARAELLAIQRETVARVQREIEGKLVRERPALRRYCEEYSEELEGPLVRSTREALERRAASSDIIYVGDYHTLEAAQRTFAWLLEAVLARRGAAAVALEMFETKDQPALDAFLAGTLPEPGFLEKVRYGDRWGFPWEHYRPILELARRTGTKVHGIDREPSVRRATLALRDRFAARTIARILAARPDVPLLVLAGDLHMARAHLPARVEEELARLGLPARRRLLVYQNAEPVYWKLARSHREQTAEVVRLDTERFCVTSATPLAKARSYLDWARCDEDAVAGDEAAGVGDDDEDRAVEVLPLLADFFQVPIPDEPALGPVPRGDALLDAIPTADGRVGGTALDRAAEDATRMLRSALAGRPDRREPPLHALALDEALAFLGSLALDHARAHRSEADFRRFLAHAGGPPASRLVARHVLRHKEAEAAWLRARERGLPRLRSLERAPLPVRAAVARALGQALGALLYRSLVAGRLGKDRIRALLLRPGGSELGRGAARQDYFALVRELLGTAQPIPRTRRVALARRSA